MCSAVRRRAGCMRDIFRKYVFITHSTQWTLYTTLRVHYICHRYALCQTHPLARSNCSNVLHLSRNTVVVNIMCVIYSCWVLCVTKYVQKKICLRDPKVTIFTICLSLQAKCKIPVFRVHPLARSTIHILSSRTFGDHTFPPPINTVQIFVWHSRACTAVWVRVLLHECVRCWCTDYAALVIIIVCCVHTLHENVNVSKS